jgi:uncharacterized protein YjbJ (UPF0337 family)
MRGCSGKLSDRRALGTEFPLLRCTDEKKSMDKEHLKGATDKAKGALKDAAGKVTGDTKLQAEGKLDKARGAAHNLAGDAKDAARSGAHVVDNVAKK